SWAWRHTRNAELNRLDERPAIYTLSLADLQSLRFEHGKDAVVLEPKQVPPAGRVTWVTLVQDGSTLSFRGHRMAEKGLARFAPLRAQRALGPLSAERLQQAGLAPPTETVTVTSVKEQRKFALGTEASALRPLAESGSSRAYLVSIAQLANPQQALDRFFERSLHAFAWDEVTEIAMSARGRTARAVRLPGGTDAGWQWKGSTGSQSNPELSAWAVSLSQLTAKAPASSAAEAQSPAAVAIRYFKNRDPIGVFELGTSSSADGQTTWWGRTEWTISPVTLEGELSPFVSDISRMLMSAPAQP